MVVKHCPLVLQASRDAEMLSQKISLMFSQLSLMASYTLQALTIVIFNAFSQEYVVLSFSAVIQALYIVTDSMASSADTPILFFYRKPCLVVTFCCSTSAACVSPCSCLTHFFVFVCFAFFFLSFSNNSSVVSQNKFKANLLPCLFPLSTENL